MVSLALTQSRQALRSLCNYEKIKSLVFFYVLFQYLLKSHRHLRARGVQRTLSDIWQSLAKRAILIVLKLPKHRQKVKISVGMSSCQKRASPRNGF
ncbi:hypothetical protein SISNIDRAFT_448733 [Sistotremastrum niveocremeum HHB9708]|uniref:Uncharacterized protein n=2 Tax=Sistotremastraceae TaxID=3402574 RepID=A0A165A503_9AGAM|nr:hypothetical protein SISNIDRAFT_448733 [Sistotremastrum niveocremeum HHB9708]KZT43586.1 hypothetical protein SISSUDRAFT_1040042 [Sistotremastrum suecicum HHB10207 ss-3]